MASPHVCAGGPGRHVLFNGPLSRLSGRSAGVELKLLDERLQRLRIFLIRIKKVSCTEFFQLLLTRLAMNEKKGKHRWKKKHISTV